MVGCFDSCWSVKEEDKEKKALVKALKSLRPRPFPYQLSGSYCQTEVYRVATWDKSSFRTSSSENRIEKEIYSCMHGVKSIETGKNKIDWLVWDVDSEKEWETTPHDTQENALKDLISRDHAMAHNSKEDRHISKSILPAEELGINHYKAFSAWKNISPENSGAMETLGNHVVTNGACLLSEFNKKATETTFSVENYIIEVIHFLANIKLGEVIQRNSDVDMDVVIMGRQLEKMFNCLQSQHKNIEALENDNSMERVKIIKETEREIMDCISNAFSSFDNTVKYGLFFIAEFKVLQMSHKCDWSKIPDVYSFVQEKHKDFKNLYQKCLDEKTSLPPRIK